MKQHIIYISTSYINQGIIPQTFLSKITLAQKCRRVAWATIRKKSLGEPLLVSPGRGMLAWARKLVPATVPSCSNHPNTTPKAKTAFSSTHGSI